jgi:hypothetical protein
MKTTKIITLIAIVILAISCKKEKQNDVNIDEKTVNISINAGLSGKDTVIDIDGDGYYEYNLYSNFPGGNNSNAQIGINSYATGNFDLEFSTEVQGVINEITKVFPENSEINASTGTWKADAIFYFYDAGISTAKLGFNDVGDKYIGVRYRNRMISTTDYYYGWMKVNVSNQHSVSIKGFAFQKQKNTAINAGAI